MPVHKQRPVIRAWLVHARSDLELACVKKTPKIHYEHLCFHAQQTAEKSIKALLLWSHVEIPRTHDLSYLTDLLPEKLVRPPHLLVLPVLTKYAVQFRYPGQETSVTRKDYLKAVELARLTLDWVNDLIK